MSDIIVYCLADIECHIHLYSILYCKYISVLLPVYCSSNRQSAVVDPKPLVTDKVLLLLRITGVVVYRYNKALRGASLVLNFWSPASVKVRSQRQN